MSDEVRHVVNIPFGSAEPRCNCGWSTIATPATAASAGHGHLNDEGWQVVEARKLNGDLQLITGRRLSP